MDEPFTPHNELEHKLIAAQQGTLASDAFMHDLLEAQVFMPVEDEPNQIQGFQRSTKATPLTLANDNGDSTLLLFTSPERAKPFVVDFPAYRGGLLVDFSWVLGRVGSGIAMSINPGLEFGIDLDPETVEQLIHLNTERNPPDQPG